jgi:hypothetical protein
LSWGACITSPEMEVDQEQELEPGHRGGHGRRQQNAGLIEHHQYGADRSGSGEFQPHEQPDLAIVPLNQPSAKRILFVQFDHLVMDHDQDGVVRGNEGDPQAADREEGTGSLSRHMLPHV